MSSNNNDNQYSSTVMPKEDEQRHAQQTSQGAPGIHIPSNAEEINELRQPRKEDAQALNDRMKAQGHGVKAGYHEFKDEPWEQKKEELKQKAQETKASLRDNQGDAKDVYEHNQQKNEGNSMTENVKQGAVETKNQGQQHLANAADSLSNLAEKARDKLGGGESGGSGGSSST